MIKRIKKDVKPIKFIIVPPISGKTAGRILPAPINPV